MIFFLDMIQYSVPTPEYPSDRIENPDLIRGYLFTRFAVACHHLADRSVSHPEPTLSAPVRDTAAKTRAAAWQKLPRPHCHHAAYSVQHKGQKRVQFWSKRGQIWTCFVDNGRKLTLANTRRLT